MRRGTRGTYTLLVHVPYELSLNIGGLGRVDFKGGYYAYIGSALGGVEGRVGRHLREEKKIRWHIDHLLIHARAVDVVVARSEERKECVVARGLAKDLPSVKGFGSSDCGCESHLFYSPNFTELLRRVLEEFKACGLKPEKGVRYE
jgi:Uri superfamily endonuclease